jgi:hypothetical protein
MNERDIDITIDEVLLDAPFGARSGALREALAAHLARLFAERGAPEGARGHLRLPRASFDVPAGLPPEAVARRVAEALYERLARREGGRR